MEKKENWKNSTLNECLELIIDHRGITPKKKGGDWSEKGIPTLSAMNINSGKLVRPEEIRFVDKEMFEKWMPQKLKQGDVILTSEAPLGEAYYVENPNYCLGQRLFGLRTKKHILNSIFFYYFLISKKGQDSLNKRATGSTAKGIRQKELVKIIITLPTIHEQQKIASILSNVSKLIIQYDHTVQTTKKIKSGLTQKLLTKGIGHKKFKKVKWYFRKEIEIPEEWTIKIFSDISHEILDGEHISPKFTQNGIPYLSSQHIKNEIQFHNCKYVDSLTYSEIVKRINPEYDDILLTVKGTIGNCKRIDIYDEFCFDRNVGLIKPINDTINSIFLEKILQFSFIQNQILFLIDNNVIPLLYLNRIKKIKIILPSLSEQQKIAEILSRIDEKISEFESKKSNLENLKKGLMQKLLTGKMRVKI